MKGVMSPYNDEGFNSFLYLCCINRLRQKACKFESFSFEFEGTKYTLEDIIKLLKHNGRSIYFSNQKIINHLVYDLGQRFWCEVLRDVNNLIRWLYLRYNGEKAENDKSTFKRQRAMPL